MPAAYNWWATVGGGVAQGVKDKGRQGVDCDDCTLLMENGRGAYY